MFRLLTDQLAEENPSTAQLLSISTLVSDILSIKGFVRYIKALWNCCIVDNKFSLKIRTSGTLRLLSNRVINPSNPKFCTSDLLKLILSCCLRSGNLLLFYFE
jgi:hypothetical protein